MERLPLGKQPATEDHRDITFKALKEAGAALGITLPVAPATFGHGTIYKDGNARGQWMMLGNGPDDTVEPGFGGAGCCFWSSGGHATMEANKALGRTVTITGKETIADYSAGCGYVIGQPNTDVGTNMREGLKYRQKIGLLDAAGKRHKIGAYVSIAPGDFEELAQAAYIFGHAEIGFEFTAAQYDQFDRGDTWDYVAGSPVEGGHAIPDFGRNRAHGAGVVSWQRHLWFTRALLEHQNDETWVIIDPDSLRNGKTERGYDLTALTTLLGELH
jgi:hypothetical protein